MAKIGNCYHPRVKAQKGIIPRVQKWRVTEGARIMVRTAKGPLVSVREYVQRAGGDITVFRKTYQSRVSGD